IEHISQPGGVRRFRLGVVVPAHFAEDLRGWTAGLSCAGQCRVVELFGDVARQLVLDGPERRDEGAEAAAESVGGEAGVVAEEGRAGAHLTGVEEKKRRLIASERRG